MGIFINSNIALCCCETTQANDLEIIEHSHNNENISEHHHDDEIFLTEPTHSDKENHCSNSPRGDIQYWVVNKNVNIKLVEYEKLKNSVPDSLSVWLAFLIADRFNSRELASRPPIDSYVVNQPIYAPQAANLRI